MHERRKIILVTTPSVMVYCVILVLVGTIKFKFSKRSCACMRECGWVLFSTVAVKDGFQLARCNYIWIDDTVIAF